MKASSWLLHWLLFLSYNGRICPEELKSFHGKTGWEVVETSKKSYRSVRANFTVSFPVEYCCPFVLLFATSGSRPQKDKTCILGPKYLVKASEVFGFAIFLRLPNEKVKTSTGLPLPNTHQCKDTQDGNYRCTGSMNAVTYRDDTWDWIVGYGCDCNQTVQIDYDVSFSHGPVIHCSPYSVTSGMCDNLGFTDVVLPTIWASPDQNYSARILSSLKNLVNSGCHKYLREYKCSIHLTPCYPARHQEEYPCREFCEEVQSHCPNFIRNFFKFKTCEFYPPKTLYRCYWPEVSCSEPEAPPQGSVEVKGIKLGNHAKLGEHAIYSCNFLFYLDGKNVRTCQASGDWSGEVPHCKAFSTTGVITFTLLFIIVILIAITYGCSHLKELDIALYARFNVSLFGKRLHANLSQKVHDVFVVYNHGDQDRGFVHDELLPLLGQHGISYITEDCFTPGRDVFTCLEMHLKQSRSALVIITSDFLQENWNLYYLNQAVCTEIHQTNFRVVFLLRQKVKYLGPLPENLSLFLRVNATIKGYKQGWEDQLIYELKHKTKKLVNQRLTFGNDSDPQSSSVM